jgi:hypothetical protein
MSRKTKYISLLCALALIAPGCAWNPESIKPVPVAAGQDPLVVNIERLQVSSIEIYKQTTEWEYANRVFLPEEVSRAVDKVRAEFPKAWRESRLILADYKAGKTSGENVDKLAAALSAAQTSLLRLKVDGNEAFQVINSIAELSRLIKQLRN